MNIWRLSGTIPFAVAGIQTGRCLWNECKDRKCTWSDKTPPLQHFMQIAGAPSPELAKELFPKQCFNLTPLLHFGNLGYATQEEAAAFIRTVTQALSLAAGSTIAIVPVFSFFTICQQSAFRCTQIMISDLWSYSGFSLIIGAYFISRFAQMLFLFPLQQALTNDTLLKRKRFTLISHEYAKMCHALSAFLNLPVDDPKRSRVAFFAKQFLTKKSLIEREISTRLALSHEEIQTFLLPLTTLSQQLALDHAL